jgi:hypothetical protein
MWLGMTTVLIFAVVVLFLVGMALGFFDDPPGEL